MWRILNNKLCFKLETSIAIVLATVCLHNFVLNKKLERGESIELSSHNNPVTRNSPQVENYYHEGAIPVTGLQQREILANYFQSTAGAIV